MDLGEGQVGEGKGWEGGTVGWGNNQTISYTCMKLSNNKCRKKNPSIS